MRLRRISASALPRNSVRQNARAFAVTFERAHDVQQVSVIALPGGRRAEVFEAFVRIVLWVDAGAPAFVAERRIGNDVIKRLEAAALLEFRIGDRVALDNQRRGVV